MATDTAARSSVFRRHQLATYFGLTYAISWAIWLGLTVGSLDIGTPAGAVLNVVAIAGPSIAALVLATVLGRGELRRLLAGFSLSRLSVRWAAVALVLPLVMMAAAIAGSVAIFGAPRPSVSISVGGVVLVEFVRVLFLGGPIGEELGWRGFALPRLQQHRNALLASILLGLVWGLWHLPLYFVLGTGRIRDAQGWHRSGLCDRRISRLDDRSLGVVHLAVQPDRQPYRRDPLPCGDQRGGIRAVGTGLGGNRVAAECCHHLAGRHLGGGSLGSGAVGISAPASCGDPAMSTVRPAVLPTTLGLIVALAGPFLVQLVLAPMLLRSPIGSTSAVLLSQLMLLLLAGTVVVITRWWERKPWIWLGVRPLSWSMALLAGAIGVVLAFAVAALTVAVNQLIPPSRGGTVESVATLGPAWLLLVGVVTASVTEELLFRAYPIERLTRLTGRRWPGAWLSLVAFVAYHLQGWNLGHVLGVVLPLGAVMTGLYLWRRNLVFMIIAHFLLDLPIVLLALGVLPAM